MIKGCLIVYHFFNYIVRNSSIFIILSKDLKLIDILSTLYKFIKEYTKFKASHGKSRVNRD